jgi:hypothetical protein
MLALIGLILGTVLLDITIVTLTLIVLVRDTGTALAFRFYMETRQPHRGLPRYIQLLGMISIGITVWRMHPEEPLYSSYAICMMFIAFQLAFAAQKILEFKALVAELKERDML